MFLMLVTSHQLRDRTVHFVTRLHFLCSWTGESDEREQSKLEVKVWDPNSPLTDQQIDQFLVVAR